MTDTTRTARPLPLLDEDTPTRLQLQKLRNTLRLNAVTSLTGGAFAVAAGAPLARWIGTGHPARVRFVGAGLVLFAVAVLALAGARTSRLLRGTPVVIGADTTWVIASAMTGVAGWYATAGMVIVALVGAQVAALAVRQTTTWHRARTLVQGRAPRLEESPPVEVVHIERRMEADTGTAWAVITDHDLYGRLALNLSGVHATTGDGDQLRRTCTSRGGEAWQEACTLWDDHHRYEIAVDTSNYPYPLAVMRGGWSVTADDETHVRVGMDFRFQPRPGPYGRIFAAAMHAAFPLVLRRILTGWQREMQRRDRP